MKSLYTEEDKKPHISSAAVIEGKVPGTILLQKHKKLNKWTLPGGKGQPGDNPSDILKKEIHEECGIHISDHDQIAHEVYDAERDGLKVKIPLYLFHVKSYTGEIKNTEPEKHPVQDFLDPHQLVLKGEPISQVLSMWLKYKRNNK